MDITSPNFAFLGAHDPQLVRLGSLAERYFAQDPSTCLIKLRQFGEFLAQLTAAKSGLFESVGETQADLLRRLRFESILPRDVAELFHQVRVAGNRAAHEAAGDHAEALAMLKVARQLGVWFHRTFGEQDFSPGPFAPPADPAAATALIHTELGRLRRELDESRSAAEKVRLAAEEVAHERISAEERARQEQEERVVWEQLAAETEQANAALARQLQTLQATAEQAPAQATATIAEKAKAAAKRLDLDEATTRALIDAQLRTRGWEANTMNLRFSVGTRPSKGRNLAIAEWPTKGGLADYALFIGTQCVGVIEAKRKNRNISSAIDQAQRYARTIRLEDGAEPVGGPWADTTDAYRVPFVFSANGRPYLKQLETESGIWFRDARRPTNHRRALVDWYTPDGLTALLQQDAEAAHTTLAAKSIEFAFPLRPYQKRAIEIVEAQLADDRREMLLAMATGTGKTKLAIALLYRLLDAKRFRRVCFVVDRNALGQQAAGEFTTTQVVSAKRFGDIFGLTGLETAVPEPETKVHICTIQSLVKRVLYADDPASVPPIDQYDLIVVDECHRGYLLDRELSDTELAFRSQDDYISKYRRVLEHFDAVKIGLTATPALHTVSIFGSPVYTYSYREAVIDGFLIDHEPPVQITTALSKSGITFAKGEQVEVINPSTGELDLAQLPDEVRFEVDEFNQRVITESFNQVVAEELARHIDPTLPGKTLIFAASNAHADMVVKAIRQAFKDAYGEIEDDAVKKITGKVDHVGQLIRSFRNDTLPKIAVTVDLLTTGIDVPRIENLVFLRRVNSRILYEQMLGRATRRCDEIGKETFRIFDAVDLYRNLQNFTQMKPVVVNPNITLEQLLSELGQVETEEQRETVRDQLLVQLRRRLNRLSDQARAQYQAESGETPEATLQRFATEPTAASAAWVRAHASLGPILDWDPDGSGTTYIPISHHRDRIIEVRSGYGTGQKPEDFLDSFTTFVQNNVNKIAALNLVVQRPRELTRAELRALRVALDGVGYSETALRRAWSDAKNEDIAASIIGFVRQAALGDALRPFEERVRAAMGRILASRSWTPVQRQWLKRIEEQVIREVVVDRAALDEEPFRKDGGFTRLDKIFGNELEGVLADINEFVWGKAA